VTRKRVTLALILALILLAVGVMVIAVPWRSRKQEPLYRGRTVSVWLETHDKGIPDALAHFGTNALPYILELAGKRDSRLKSAALRVPIPKGLLSAVGMQNAYDNWARASYFKPGLARVAFGYMGSERKVAVPSLVTIFLSTDNPAGQAAVAGMLGSLGEDASEAMVPLTQRVNDPSFLVHTECSGALLEINGALVANHIFDKDPHAQRRRSVALALARAVTNDATRASAHIRTFVQFTDASPNGNAVMASLWTNSDVRVRQAATNVFQFPR